MLFKKLSTSNRSKKIQIEGAFGESNFGDDLLLLTTLNILSSCNPNSKIYINAREASFKGDYLDSYPFKTKVLRGLTKYLIFSDFYIYAGGTQFYSFPPMSHAKKFKENISTRIIRKISKLFNRSKIIILAVGVGPFLDGNEEASKKVVSSARYISLRDEKSEDHLKRWGVNINFVGTDLCYASKYWLDPQNTSKVNLDSKYIGIVIREFDYDLPEGKYMDQLDEFIKYLIKNNHHIRYFAFSEKVDNKTIKLLEKNNKSITVWKGDYDSLNAYLEDLRSCKMIISARYHGVVVSSILGIPSIGINVDPKIRIALTDLGMVENCWEAPFNVEHLIRMFDENLKNIVSNKKKLVENAKYLGFKSEQMIDSFREYIGNHE